MIEYPLATDLIKTVLYLIDSGKGDIGRLNYILNRLQDGKPLFISDRKYLEPLISRYIDLGKRRDISIPAGDSVEDLKNDLMRLNERLSRLEKRGYKHHIGRKAVFFFVTFFVGWHAVIQIVNKLLSESDKVFNNTQDLNRYIFPLYQIKSIIPTQFAHYVDLGILYGWGAMIITWIILGFIYLVKFIRSRYNP